MKDVKEVMDKEARERAESDLENTYLVDAGAGTGKTTVLVSRVMNILLNEKSTLDRIVVITFTEKAAGELKFRIREEIDKQLKDANAKGNQKIKETLSRAIADIEKAPISTIHSFCTSILKERPIEAGLTPNFEVADEFESAILFDEGWEEWLEAELSEEDKENEALKLAIKLELKLNDLRDIAKKIFDNRDFLWCIEDPAPDAPATRKILWWLKGAVEYIEKLANERDVVDFQDLLLKTRNLLKNKKEVRRYFIEKYDYILVDEFQDTDPLQAEIVFFLAEEKPIANDWSECKLKPGKLFLVGDPKQSIYGFRRADIEMYSEVKDIIEKQGRIEALKQNFRTVKNIIDWVNKKFGEIIKESGYQPQYIKISPYRGEESQTERTSVWFLNVPLPEDISKKEFSKDTIRKREAESVAIFINSVVNNWEVWDKKSNGWRKLGYGDIALLFLTRTGLKFFERAFKKHQIPYISVGATTFLTKTEIADVINCLKAINNPQDNIAMIGALRSSFFGFSDEEIFLARENGLDFDYTKPMPQNEHVEIFEDAYRLLNKLHKKRNETKISSLIMELYDRTMAPAVYLGEQGEEQRIGNLMKIVEMAREFENISAFTFGMFVDYIENQQYASEGGEEEAMVWEADDPFVRLMTIHGAKGLEFPLVIIADHTLEKGRGKNNKWKIIFDRKNNKVELIINAKMTKGEELTLWDEEEVKNLAEVNRLLYVACTRARDYLILPCSSQIRQNAFTDMLVMERGQNEINPDELNRGTPSLPKESRKPVTINYSAELEKWRAEKSEKLNKIMREDRFKSVTSLYKGEQLPPIVAPSAEEKRKIGSLVHSALEAIALEPTKKDNIRETIEALNLEGLADIALERAVEMVNKALETNLLQRALKAKALQKEYPIVMEENGAIISGRVDLAFVEDGGIVVVDYKTDEVATEEEAKRRVKDVYITQGEIYSKIIKKATKIPIKEVYFLFLHPTPPIAVNMLEI